MLPAGQDSFPVKNAPQAVGFRCAHCSNKFDTLQAMDCHCRKQSSLGTGCADLSTNAHRQRRTCTGKGVRCTPAKANAHVGGNANAYRQRPTRISAARRTRTGKGQRASAKANAHVGGNANAHRQRPTRTGKGQRACRRQGERVSAKANAHIGGKANAHRQRPTRIGKGRRAYRRQGERVLAKANAHIGCKANAHWLRPWLHSTGKGDRVSAKANASPSSCC
jgi:hypothetical protein